MSHDPSTLSAHAESANAGQSSGSGQTFGSGPMGQAARETSERVAHSAAEFTQDCTQHYVAEPARDLFAIMKDYAKEKPDVAAMWCFALGVVVGWKLKP